MQRWQVTQLQHVPQRAMRLLLMPAHRMPQLHAVAVVVDMRAAESANQYLLNQADVRTTSGGAYQLRRSAFASFS
jgi:hypothetical protein